MVADGTPAAHRWNSDRGFTEVAWLSGKTSKPTAVSGARFAGHAAQLAHLNREYLDLLLRQQTLPVSLAPLSSLSRAAMELISNSSMALFSLQLDDRNAWLPLFDSAQHGRAPSNFRSTFAVDAQAEFARAALFFSWHLANCDRLAARMLLDIDCEISSALRSTQITQLQFLAADAVDFLQPRWVGNERFWTTTIECAQDGNEEGLRDVRLLGCQLSAFAPRGVFANRATKRRANFSSAPVRKFAKEVREPRAAYG